MKETFLTCFCGLRSNSESRRFKELSIKNIRRIRIQIGSKAKSDKAERGPEVERSLEFNHFVGLICSDDALGVDPCQYVY